MELTLFTLLHLLVFAYWLGGDIGVFYSSLLLTDDRRDTPGRLAAGKILADVDLVPRFCLLLTLPTGLALANAKGWLLIGTPAVAITFAIALAWCFLVFQLHVRHSGMDALKRFDMIARVIFLIGLIGAGLAGLLGTLSLPMFIALKLLVLGFAIAMGLTVRVVLKPFGPAYMQLATEGADPQTNEIIRTSLNRARPAVMAIWFSLVVAAWLGVATPS